MTLDVELAMAWLVRYNPAWAERGVAEMLHDYSLFVSRKQCDHLKGKSWTSAPGCNYEICGTCLLTRPRPLTTKEALNKIRELLEQIDAG